MDVEYTVHPKLEVVLSRLEDVRRQADGGFRARCPIHGGRSPDDMGLREGDKWIIWNCFAGCDSDEIRKALELEWSDLLLDDSPVAERKRRRRDWRAIELEAMACAVRLQHEPEVLKRLRFGYVTGYSEGVMERVDGELRPVEIRDGRGWSAKALELLDVGWDGLRLTLPVRTAEGKLHDVLRYDPFAKTHKVLAGHGKSRLPWPAPERVDAETLFLVEGEGTAISMLTVGFKAVALPGSISKPRTDVQRPGIWQGAGWHRKWAERFTRFLRIVLLPDCDAQGRALMRAASYDLDKAGVENHVLDIGPRSEDGSDIADHLLHGAWDGRSRKAAHRVIREMVASEAGVLA